MVVGTGIKPQARTTDAVWNLEGEWYWEQWGKIADYRKRIPLWMLERLAVKSLICDGEGFFVLLANGQIQPIEAARIKTPAEKKGDPLVVQGVQLNASGMVLGYYVCDRLSNASNGGVVFGGTIDDTKSQYVSANDMIHIYDPTRFDQCRGVPLFASAIALMEDKREFS